MAEYKIFHNPRCSKSRQALEILESNDKDFEIFLYLQETLNKKSIKSVLDILGLNPKDILRSGEVEYKENKLSQYDDEDEKLIDFMIKYPKIIERPIVIKGNKGVIGRPPENVIKLF
jgi:arsenate reductase